MPYSSIGSPFQVGGSLPANATTYVRRQADTQLYQAVRQGQFCYVFNARQMGKSSLRVQAMERLRQDGRRCVTIDLTTIGTQHITPEQWYASFAAILVSQLQLSISLGEWWRSRSHLSYVARFAELIDTVVLPQVQAPIVLFIDEVDSVLGLPFATHDFFGLIRNYYNRRADEPAYRRLTFVLLGVTTPSALIQDKRLTPFNIGQAIELHGFQWIEAMPLLDGLRAYLPSPQQVLQQILYWTDGQPFLTQKLCQLVSHEIGHVAQHDRDGSIQQLVQTYVIDNWESQDEPEHLRTIRDRLLHQPSQAVKILHYYQRLLRSPQGALAIDHGPIQWDLILSGIVQVRQGNLTVKNPIYEAVFNLDWVDQQLAQLAQMGLSEAIQPLTMPNLPGAVSPTGDPPGAVAPKPPLRSRQSEAVDSPANHHRSFISWRWKLLSLGFGLCSLGAGWIGYGQWQASQQRQVEADLAAAQALIAQIELADQANRSPPPWQAALFHAQRAYHTSQVHYLPRLPAQQLLQRILYRYSSDDRWRTQIEPTSPVLAAGFTADGKQVWLLNHRGELGRWSSSKAVQWQPFIRTPLAQIHWPSQQDSPFVLDRQQQLWRLTTEQPTRLLRLDHRRPVKQLVSDAQGTTLAVLWEMGQVKLWRYEQGQLFPIAAAESWPQNTISLQFFHENPGFVSTDQAGAVNIHQANGQLQHQVQTDTLIQQLAISPKDDLLVGVGADQQLYLWSNQGKLLRRYGLPAGEFSAIALNDDSSLIALGRQDGQILLYSDRGQVLAVLPGAQAITHLAFGSNSQQLLSRAADQPVSLWSIPIVVAPSQWLGSVCAELQAYFANQPHRSAELQRICD